MRPNTFVDPNAAPRRATEVRRLRSVLLRTGWPRLQMMLLVTLTVAAGVLISLLLHRGGMESMALRYPVAVLGAYLVFLGLLRFWLRGTPDEFSEALDLGADFLPRRGVSLDWQAGGFSGGEQGGGDGSLIDAAELGEGLPVLLVVLLVALCAALFWALASVVWSAPTLFAELLVDGALAAGLYRRLRRADRRHWLESALRGTAWPFGLTLASSLALGLALQWYAPQASTLAQVFGS